jgi:hypothetical protein
LLAEDRIFEDAHNTMISRLNSFQSLHPKEKILWAMATLTDFDKFYQAALASKNKLQDYFDRIAHQTIMSAKEKLNIADINPD